MLSAYFWLSIALSLAQMVLDVLKNFKPAQFYMLNNICFYNFAQNSSPGVILALGLLLVVYSRVWNTRCAWNKRCGGKICLNSLKLCME